MSKCWGILDCIERDREKLQCFSHADHIEDDTGQNHKVIKTTKLL